MVSAKSVVQNLEIRNPSVRGINAKYLKRVIASTINNEIIEKLRNQFIPAIPFEELAEMVKKPSNWIQLYREIQGEKRTRVFELKLPDGAIRCYVYSDLEDRNILALYFEVE